MEVPFEIDISSAHRTPNGFAEYARSARGRSTELGERLEIFRANMLKFQKDQSDQLTQELFSTNLI